MAEPPDPPIWALADRAGLGRVLDRLALSPGTHVPAALMQDQLAHLAVGPDDKRDLGVHLLDEEMRN